MNRFDGKTATIQAFRHRGRPLPMALYATLGSLLVHAVAVVFVLSQLHKESTAQPLPVAIDIELATLRPPAALEQHQKPRPHHVVKATQGAQSAAPKPVEADSMKFLKTEPADAAPLNSQPLAEATNIAATAANPAGDALTLPRFDAAYLHNPSPPYPAAARRLGLEGTVIIRVRVTPEGVAEHAEVAHSSGVAMLDQAALLAVQRWSFVPARRGGLSLAALVDVPIRFHLD